MADNPVLDRLSGFAAQPATRQLSLLTGFAASVALAIGLVNWATTPSYEPVYGAMSPADNATAINVLQTSGIKYRMEPGTGLLEVPYDDVLQARMALASEGFPRNGGGIGFESLYQEQEMGLSSFMEQARYHRAVEAELARTIAAMDSVSGARVHLAIAKQSAFMRRGNEPSASVMVNLLPGVRLNDRQLSGIIHLVASSIPNLDAERVSVVDQAGKLLSSQGEDTEFGYTAEQFRLAQQFENALNDRILAILRGVTDIIFGWTNQLWKTGLEAINDSGGIVHRESRLCKVCQFVFRPKWQSVNLLSCLNERERPRCLTHGADHFIMSIMTNQKDMIILFGVLNCLKVNFRNEWAGGINRP